MKRLLAAGSGNIFQISKAFRYAESGQVHNPEFSLLEWYRLDFDHHQLMDEVEALLQVIGHWPLAQRITYQGLFQTYVGIDVLNCSDQALMQWVQQQGFGIHDL